VRYGIKHLAGVPRVERAKKRRASLRRPPSWFVYQVMEEYKLIKHREVKKIDETGYTNADLRELHTL
jgi:hypothetical protein